MRPRVVERLVHENVNSKKSESMKGIFSGATRARGEGLNVQAANTVLLVEPCLNPALDDKAVARPYTLGQTSVVTVKI